MSIQYAILLLYLGKETGLDLKKKLISTKDFIVMWILILIFGTFCQGIQVVLTGMIPGMFLIGLAKITKESIGYGDGMVLIICGMVLGIRDVILLLFLALLLEMPVALWKLVVEKASGKTEIAFVPFLMAGYLILLPILS